MIQKKKIAFFVFTLCVLLSMDSFALTPVGNISKLVSLLISTIGMGLFLLHFKKYSKRIKQFGVLMILLLISSILASNSVHSQSMRLGFAASSNIYLIGIVFLVNFVIMRYRITLEEAKEIIIKTSWVLFFIYLILLLFNYEFTTSNGENTFGVVSLRKGVVTFSAIIYLCDSFIHSKTKYLIFSLLLFSTTQFGDFQRFIFLIYILCLFALMFQFGKRIVAIKIIVALMVITPIIGLIISSTEKGAQVYQKINDTIELFDDEKDHYSDVSIEARVWQTEIALQSISLHPIVGVGLIHNSLIDQVTGVQHFYISDIGLLGVLYSFGIFGIFIFFLQILYLIKEFRTKGEDGEPQFIHFKYFLLFLLLHTILSGRSIIMCQEFLLIVMFIEIGKAQLVLNPKSSS